MAFEVIRRNKASEMVAEQIIEQINSGELTPGSQLPSQRELSELLGVGRSSVREAINALAVIGYLEVQQGKGTFIRIPEQDPSIARLQSALEASSLLVSYLLYSCFFGKRIMQMAHKPLTIRGL